MRLNGDGKAMRITIIKGETDDRLDVVRADGSSTSSRFPHKGPIPHDFVHYAAEGELGFANGFWGMVAAGRDPAEIQDMAKAAGHASAKRAVVPTADFVEAIQAERIVEAFEADHWSGGEGDTSEVVAMAEAGCRQSLVPMVEMDDAAVERIRERIADFAGRWSVLPIGGSIELDWPAAR